MFGLERCQSSERRTLLLRPGNPRTEETSRLEPPPHQQLDLLLECIRAGEILKRGLELTVLRPEPLAEEYLKRLELGLHQPAALRIRHRQGRIGKLAEHVDIWHAPRLRGLEGCEQLVGRPRRIGLPVWHVWEVGRKLSANARPEDRYHNVAGDGVRDLGLETLIGCIEMLLP